MRIFEIQDSLYLFDSEPVFILHEKIRDEWRLKFQESFSDFCEFLRKHHRDSYIWKFLMISMEPELKESWEECKTLAQAGYPPAAYLVSFLFETGEFGHPINMKLSKQYERLAAALGHPQALWNMGSALAHSGEQRGQGIILQSALLGFSAAIEYIITHKEMGLNLDEKVGGFNTVYDF